MLDISNKITKIFQQIFPVEKERVYMIWVLSRIFYGKETENKIYILFSPNYSGKTTFIRLCDNLFRRTDNIWSMCSSVLTHPKFNVGYPGDQQSGSWYDKMLGKKLYTTHEPDLGKTIRLDRIRQFFCLEPYTRYTGEELYPKFGSVLIPCNKYPSIEELPDDLLSRVVLVKFRSIFVDKKHLVNHEKFSYEIEHDIYSKTVDDSMFAKSFEKILENYRDIEYLENPYEKVTQFQVIEPELAKKIFTSQQSSGEKICQSILEKVLGVTFTKCRPKFLLNPKTGKRLELDMYNQDLNLAVEYQGNQHYNYTEFFHDKISGFENQIYRDAVKKRLCTENGINLIIVPCTVKQENIELFLVNTLRGLNYM